MPSTYQFPDLDSNFLDLYNRFAGSSDFSQYLQPDDPDVLAYQRRSMEPTGSEALLRDYVSRRPTYEEYEPGLGRKMASFLLGTLSGVGNPARGYEIAQQHKYMPIRQAFSDWENEGQNLPAIARTMEAERGRELAGMRYGLQTKAAARRGEISQTFRQEQEARRLAGEVAGEEERKARVERDTKQQEFMNDLRVQNRTLQDQIHQDTESWRAFMRLNVEHDNKVQDELKAAKAQSYATINKKLEDYASQQGFDTSDIDHRSLAKLLAFQKLSAHPAFKDIIVPKTARDGSVMGYTFAGDPRRIKNAQYMIDQLIAKYLRGEGY